MKKLLNASLLFSIISFSSLSSCCKDKGCSVTTEIKTKSVNLFDRKPTSAYYNQVVAGFKLNQTVNDYKDATRCSSCSKSLECATTLSITNGTNKTMIFDYSVSFNLNLINWNYQGVATIAAGGTLEVGQINTNCGDLNLGTVLVQSANITYQ